MCVLQNCPPQVSYLLQLEEVLEQSQTKQDLTMQISGEVHNSSSIEQNNSLPIKQSNFFPRSSLPIDSPNLTFEEINEGYIDGSLPTVDPRVVLLGCEGSGKTSLIDTFIGKSFQHTPATEGADQMEISVTTAANWELMNENQKILDLKNKHCWKQSSSFPTSMLPLTWFS